MPENTKPIKRSPQLAPLSREHHEGLLFAWKIRQGISKNIETSRLSAFVNWFWQQHLYAHFNKEEAALPAVLSSQHPFIQQMFQEHAEIKKLLEEAAHYEDLKKFEMLAQKLTAHIRFEERQLFGEIEKAATPVQLEVLSEQLQDEKNNTVWEDEFWVNVT